MALCASTLQPFNINSPRPSPAQDLYKVQRLPRYDPFIHGTMGNFRVHSPPQRTLEPVLRCREQGSADETRLASEQQQHKAGGEENDMSKGNESGTAGETQRVPVLAGEEGSPGPQATRRTDVPCGKNVRDERYGDDGGDGDTGVDMEDGEVRLGMIEIGIGEDR